MGILSGIEPEKVMFFFEEISKIPRGSGNTKEISDYCVKFAKDRNLKYIQDELNNIIIFKEASDGRQGQSGVIIQGHLDMVNEKTNRSEHDFMKDPINIFVDGDFIKGKDTTLGGDNGIAVAYGLAILDDDSISHPYLECVFTVDEETGMFGAAGIDISKLKGKYLLNLDNEEEGVLVAGCAGGAKVETLIPVNREIESGIKYNILINGLKGGHSGIEIHKERGNADIIMGEFLNKLYRKKNFRIISLKGGNKDNAIPRESFCELMASEKILAEEIVFNIKKEFEVSDKDIQINIFEKGKTKENVLSLESTDKILKYLNLLQNGVINMNPFIEGLVETSLNLGIMELYEDNFKCVSSVRSSVKSRKESLVNKLCDLSDLMKGKVTIKGDYPEWSFEKDSSLRELMKETYKRMYGKELKIDVIHAGLECGYLLEKRPDLDAVSYGPNMWDIHTTEEKISISSIESTYKYVLEILKEIR